MSEQAATRRKMVVLRVYSRIHHWPLGGWWIAERIIWPLFIKEYP